MYVNNSLKLLFVFDRWGQPEDSESIPKRYSEKPPGGGGLRKFLCSKMSVDWLKIGLNSAEKITLLSLRIPLEGNLEILFSPYKLPQPSGYEGT